MPQDDIARPLDLPNPPDRNPNANHNTNPNPNPNFYPDLDPDEPDLSADDNIQPPVVHKAGLPAGHRDPGDRIPRTPVPAVHVAQANAPANMTYIRVNAPIPMPQDAEKIAQLPMHKADDIANVTPPAAQTPRVPNPPASPIQPKPKPPSSVASSEKGKKLAASASISLNNSDITRNEFVNTTMPATTGLTGPSSAKLTVTSVGKIATNASMGIACAKETLGKFPADSGIVPISMGKSPADSGFVPISKQQTMPVANSDCTTNTMMRTVRPDGNNAPIDYATVVPDLIRRSQETAESLAHDLDKYDLAPVRPRTTATTTTPTDATTTDPCTLNTWSEHYRQVLPNPMGPGNSICSATVGDSLPPARINARPVPSNVSAAPAVSCAKPLSSNVVKQSQYEQMTSTYAHFPSESYLVRK